MSAALHTARSGLDAQDMRMRVISNNLANVNTTGFKRDRPDFETLMYQNVRQAGAQSSQQSQLANGMNVGTGVKVVGTERIYTQGSMVTTERSLDVAINGDGFFQVEMPDGKTGYTRAGNFAMDSEGKIVTSEGYAVTPAITIPKGAQSLTIGSDGTVSAQLAGETSSTQLGQIQTASFVNPSGLQPVGQNLLTETSASGSPQVGTPGEDGLGSLSQNSLEASNVNVVEELVDMIETQRAYEVNSKMISATDDMLKYVNQNL